jgi:hypothetical protein
MTIPTSRNPRTGETVLEPKGKSELLKELSQARIEVVQTTQYPEEGGRGRATLRGGELRWKFV